MERKIARVVNTGLAGEPEHAVLQIQENLKCVEFSQIKYVNENGANREVSLVDVVLDQPEILHILNVLQPRHQVEVSLDENDNATIYF
jgi:hypothetical protein